MICAVLFGILSLRLFHLQCVEGAELTEIALSQSGRLVYNAAPRGNILDRYGRVLARSAGVPEIRLHPSELPRENLNGTILDACTLLVSAGETLSCTLPLAPAASDGQDVAFDTQELSDFQTALGISPGQSASDALGILRKKLDVPASFTPQEALSAAAVLLAARDPKTVLVNEATADDVRSLQAGSRQFSRLRLEPGDLPGNYDIVLNPDTAETLDARDALGLYNMIEKTSRRLRPGQCLSPHGLGRLNGQGGLGNAGDQTAPKRLGPARGGHGQDCLAALVKRYGIPENTGTRARWRWPPCVSKRPGLGTPANHSITLATDVSDTAIAAVERFKEGLPGIRIEQGWVREYPQGTLLSPVLGHIGRITAEHAEAYKALGYDLNADLVGRDGLENSTKRSCGVPSVICVDVDAWGRPVNERRLSYGEAGQDIILTIDSTCSASPRNRSRRR